MAYTLKTTGVIAGYTVRSALVVNEAGTGVQDLVAGNTISVHANVTYGSASWRGTSRPFFTPTGTGTTLQGVTWTGTKPAIPSGATGGATVIVILNGWGASSNDGGSEVTTRPLLRAAGASHDLNFRLGITKPNLGRGGSAVHTATTDSLGDAQSAYVFHCDDYSANNGTRQRTAAGSLSTEETSTDPGFIIADGVLESYGGDTAYWFQPETYAMLVIDGIVSDSDANAIIDDWFGTLIESGGGSAVGAAAHYYRQLQG